MNLIERSISAGIFIIVIVGLRALLMNKMPKRVFLILWGAAVFRLLVPYSILSSWSIFSVLGDMSSRIAQESVRPLPATNGSFVMAEENLSPLGGSISLAPKTSSLDSITVIWLLGAISLGIFFAVTFYKSNKELRTALPVRNQPFIDEWLGKQKTVRRIRVMTSDQVLSPIACGFLRPRIILPKTLNFRNEELLKHILTHEKLHIKHLDILWKFVLAFVLCLHWFNPLVWLMFVLVNRDLELTCDERVLRTLGEQEKSGYALSLIHMAERNAKLAAFNQGFSKNSTKERILSIMKYKQTTALTLCLSAVLIAGTVTVFATNASQADTGYQISGEAAGAVENGNSTSGPVTPVDELISHITDHDVFIKDVSEPEDRTGLVSYSYEEYKAEMENIKKAGEELVRKGKMSQDKLAEILDSMQNTLNEIKKGEVAVYKPIEMSESTEGESQDKDSSGLFLSGTKW
ncbi:hypothetical protein DCC85_03910 [Paenibacillus sp. CAA11]|uniref:M56 family metallopeptidase n=1 Tax=Paenibacillus sp. CAA11 TaxID=1532905 RepID=UPI000D36BA23|nr:M56 family metallopeptidase [Paenibacillus sp. CAA11]AWB43452.1 hypothetical protein DCC85_03910 [Paenibacillus sp. CAA11]